MELLAGCILWSIRRLGGNGFAFSRNIGEAKSHIQRWMEFISPYNFSLSYHRLPLPPTEEDISGSCALSDPVNLRVYFIRSRGPMPSSYPNPSISLTTPRSGLGGLIPQSDPPTLGRLSLTHDDLRTHCAQPPHCDTCRL